MLIPHAAMSEKLSHEGPHAAQEPDNGQALTFPLKDHSVVTTYVKSPDILRRVQFQPLDQSECTFKVTFCML